MGLGDSLAKSIQGKVETRVPNQKILSRKMNQSNTPGRIRTCDPRFRKPMLYPLSYGCTSQNYIRSWWGKGDGHKACSAAHFRLLSIWHQSCKKIFGSI